MSAASDEKVCETGPLEDEKEQVRTDPFTLPSNFMWDDLSLDDDDQVTVPEMFLQNVSCCDCVL